MKRHILAIAAILCGFASYSTTTNLIDKLRTQVEYDPMTGIDIRRLNLDSIHTDKHKSRHTQLKNMSIDVPSIKRIIQVKRLSFGDRESYVDAKSAKKG